MHVRKHGNWASFLLVPVAFSIIIMLLFYLVLSPVVMPLFNTAMLFFGNEKQQAVPPQTLYGLLQPSNESNNTINASDFDSPALGAHYGEIEIEGTPIKANLYYGDSPKELNAGVGTYAGAWLPGFERTIMLAGHTMTFFNGLGNASVDGKITIKTYYGDYVYKITHTAIKDHTDTSAYDFTREDENIVLYTCYPFDKIGLTPTRYFVYGEYVSGPKIIEDK